MTALDWLIVAAFLVGVVLLVGGTRRQVRSVADFLAGGRCAGRYLLTLSAAMAGLGAITIIAQWEQMYQVGYGATWWQNMLAPIYLVLTLSGWVIYRYRETRALTLAQFFEMRYSRRFRVLAGLLAFVSGTLNYGIFPAVGARFFTTFCGLPEATVSVAGYPVSLTYAGVMVGLLGLALWITLSGGQIAIMVSDAVQGVLCLMAACALAAFCVGLFSWEQIGAAFQAAPDPARASMVNPFRTSAVRDFNIWYYAIGAFGAIYCRMAWQGSSGYQAAARTPHEALMANVLGVWRAGTLLVTIGFLAIGAYTVMHHPEFAAVAEAARERLARLPNPTLQTQMTTPAVLSLLLPPGLLGLLCAVMLAAAVTTDDTYLHSWGSIFVQDVLLPLRGRPLNREQHLRALRTAIVGVAVFALGFSLLFRQTQYILMFMAITGAVFAAGAGAAIIGGLYWKRGTTAGAWSAMIVGAVLAAAGIVVHQFPFVRVPLRLHAPQAAAVTVAGTTLQREGAQWSGRIPLWKRDAWQALPVEIRTSDGSCTSAVLHYAVGAPSAPPPVSPAVAPLEVTPADATVLPLPHDLPQRLFLAARSLNGQVTYFIAMLASLLSYVLVSLLGRQTVDLDRLLHRGRYAVAADRPRVAATPVRRTWLARLGFSAEFSRTDKLLYGATLAWSLSWILVFFALLAMNLVRVRSDRFWLTYFKWKFFVDLGIGAVTTVWFTVGTIRDIRDLFARLRVLQRDDRDDGRVVSVASDNLAR